MYRVSIFIFLVGFIFSCHSDVDKLDTGKLFSEVPTKVTGIDFENKILESEQLHYYKYLYIYIGGGVAAADFDNDGLEDLFFTSNIYPNRLFLNKGDFKFEDITEQSGIEKRVGFDAGVSVADVNNDGFLDIYINRAGWYKGDERLANMLFINNGDLTFTEKAEEFSIADKNRSISSTFFDYDKDGDLDLYVANAPADFNLSGALLDLTRIQDQRAKIQEAKSADRLYRNNGDGSFENVSTYAGIVPDVGFGLHAQVCDLNNDGWPDIYVSNDFIMPDFAYVNNGDGTFTNQLDSLFRHISYYSMGADFADINNDGFMDLMVADMSPEDHIRSKTTMSMMPIERFNTMTASGYHHQYMHNVMQLNNGSGSFSELSNLANIAKTDWSWATLFADFDLDGYNDLYVTNGVYRDVVDRDANTEIDDYIRKNKNDLSEKDFFEFTQKLPQQKLKNYLFKNLGNLQFENASDNWADMKETFSNGAVYVDLDNDGDLDIVTNNIDEPATIMKNNSREMDLGDYLELSFVGPRSNPFGLDTKAELYLSNGEKLTRELINSRGYLSSVSNVLHFGLGKEQSIDSLVVIWSDNSRQSLTSVEHNQHLKLEYAQATRNTTKVEQIAGTIFEELPMDYVHREKIFNDFDVQLLLPHKLSQLGPAIAKADLNQDGIDDIYIGGGHEQSAQLLLSNGGSGNAYIETAVPAFQADKNYEDLSACFFDADNDGDQDLYVVSGSYEFEAGSDLQTDRLYINNGGGVFARSIHSIPEINSTGAVVVAADYDHDGDQDLFVGGRLVPGKYPYAPKSTLLLNEGGKFVDVTQEKAAELERIGMVTTAQWVDIDQDQDLDLVLAGEWMGIEVFENSNGQLSKSESHQALSTQTGWWNRVLVDDIDDDGDLDIIAGNLGLNYKFHASKDKPFHVYTNDFDQNGTEDIVLAKHYEKEIVPVRGKSCTAQQMPYLKERVKTYQQFASSNVEQIIGESIDSAIHLKAVEFRSGYFVNENGQFSFHPMPNSAQLSVVNSIICEDLDGDGHKDILLAGNNFTSEVETTRADAGKGVFLKGNEHGFQVIDNMTSGFNAPNDVRNMITIVQKKSKAIVVANNNDKIQLFKIK